MGFPVTTFSVMMSVALSRLIVEIRDGVCDFESGKTIEFDLLFCVPPHRASQSVSAAVLTDQTGWIPVDSSTMETKQQDVYALGDVTSIATPHLGRLRENALKNSCGPR